MLKLEYEVRRASEGDLDAISTIERLSFKDPYPRSFLNSLQVLHDSTFLVAIVSTGQIVGYSVTALRYGMLGHLLSVATAPDFRRKGVATALLVETMRILREEGILNLRLEVRVSNTDALRLYENMGFERADVEESYYPDGEAAQVMFKRL